jgi:hypothetical protein
MIDNEESSVMNELSARERLASEPQQLPKMWIGFMLAGVFLVVEVIHLLVSSDNEDQKGPILVLWLASLPIWFYWLFCVYKIHDAIGRIPGYEHSITPAAAVGWHFFPIYNVYWVFKLPTALADFVNWRTQTKAMKGWIAGVLVLASVLVFRYFDGFVGAMMLFAGGCYISRSLKRAFAAPPVSESAMRTSSFTSPSLR